MAIHIQRREFILSLSSMAAWSLAARAQQADRMRRIGLLMNRAADNPEGQDRIAAFHQERRITRWEHEHVLEAVQRRLDEHPEKMRQRRETVEHPFGTIKARMGATHFLMKTLPRVAAEMALHVLAYNLTRVMNIMGIQPLLAAIRT